MSGCVATLAPPLCTRSSTVHAEHNKDQSAADYGNLRAPFRRNLPVPGSGRGGVERRIVPFYIESAATGLLAGINGARIIQGMEPIVPPPTTVLGALLRYITDASRKGFQPMNSNFGLLPPLPIPARGRAKKELMAERALRELEAWKTKVMEPPKLRWVGQA